MKSACIGFGEKVVGLGEGGDKEVEKDRGYTCALRNWHKLYIQLYPGMKREGEGKVVSATGYSAFK